VIQFSGYQGNDRLFFRFFLKKIITHILCHWHLVRNGVSVFQVEDRDQQLKEHELHLAEERVVFEEECKAERAELARQWQQLRDEITRMEEMNNIQKVSQ